MTLQDFERELAACKTLEHQRKRIRSRSRERPSKASDRDSTHRKHRHKSHQSHRKGDGTSSGSHKRHRTDDQRSPPDDSAQDRKPRQRISAADVEKGREPCDLHQRNDFPNNDNLDESCAHKLRDRRLSGAAENGVKRDTWMEAPSPLDVDFVQRRNTQPTGDFDSRPLGAEPTLLPHKNELNIGISESMASKGTITSPKERAVIYQFGDGGSTWRMNKLRNVYRHADESQRAVDDVALERYGDMRDFDDAREEEVEMDRRKLYGKGYVGKEKPTGDLFTQRLSEEKKKSTMTESSTDRANEITDSQILQGQADDGALVSAKSSVLDKTTLNKLKAQLMRARLRGEPEVGKLQEAFDAAMIASASTRDEPGIVVLNAMENRMLASGRNGEVKAVENTRGRERGLVEENENMSIEDMVRQERRTRGQPNGEGRFLAERIAKDAKFDNDLEYMDENAARLARRVAKSEINLRSTAISDLHKVNRVLDRCPLCHQEDKGTPPLAPVVSLATRVYLTLPTEPELSVGGAVIVPIQHRTNLLECDDDEWEEIRNYMKCVMRMFDARNQSAIFYENAARPGQMRHAALIAIPLPPELAETASAFFKEAILANDEEWAQHRKLIDTLAKARAGLGKAAFRKTMAKEMPYFHVWFSLDGGLGHVIEDTNRWPRGDLFARETLGGMLDVSPDIIHRQGRWRRGDSRIQHFQEEWAKWDWTAALSVG